MILDLETLLRAKEDTARTAMSVAAGWRQGLDWQRIYHG
jgi:hypothetical protein